MSVGPAGNTQALSGTQQDVANQTRQTRSDLKAEQAAGLGATDADQEASDRDADGRRPWEIGADDENQNADEDDEREHKQRDGVKSKDPTGNSGGMLDLTG